MIVATECGSGCVKEVAAETTTTTMATTVSGRSGGNNGAGGSGHSPLVPPDKNMEASPEPREEAEGLQEEENGGDGMNKAVLKAAVDLSDAHTARCKAKAAVKETEGRAKESHANYTAVFAAYEAGTMSLKALLMDASASLGKFRDALTAKGKAETALIKTEAAFEEARGRFAYFLVAYAVDKEKQRTLGAKA
jgi:hypothetical protein